MMPAPKNISDIRLLPDMNLGTCQQCPSGKQTQCELVSKRWLTGRRRSERSCWGMFHCVRWFCPSFPLLPESRKYEMIDDKDWLVTPNQIDFTLSISCWVYIGLVRSVAAQACQAACPHLWQAASLTQPVLIKGAWRGWFCLIAETCLTDFKGTSDVFCTGKHFRSLKMVTMSLRQSWFWVLPLTFGKGSVGAAVAEMF